MFSMLSHLSSWAALSGERAFEEDLKLGLNFEINKNLCNLKGKRDGDGEPLGLCFLKSNMGGGLSRQFISMILWMSNFQNLQNIPEK